MALPLIIRHSFKPEGVKNVINVSTILFRPSSILRQSQTSPKLLTKPNVRNITLTAPKLSAHGDHSKLWTMERGLSVALLGIVPAALIAPCGLFDNLLAISVVAHSHWGLEAVVVDYVRPIIFGHTIPKIALGALYGVTFITLGGLLYFNFHDIGIGQAVRKIWTLKPNQN